MLLKKSAMVCATKKYTSEIEIFTFGRVFQTQISRSGVSKSVFTNTQVSGRLPAYSENRSAKSDERDSHHPANPAGQLGSYQQALGT